MSMKDSPIIDSLSLQEQNDPHLINFTRPFIIYSTIAWGAVWIAFLLFKLRHYCRNGSKPSVICNELQRDFTYAVQKSLAAYFSDHKVLQATFFLYCVFCFTIGQPIYSWLILERLAEYDTVYKGAEMTSEVVLMFIIHEICCILASGASMISLFLVTMIGAKREILSHTKNPFKTVILTRYQKMILVQTNLKRALMILVLMTYVISLIVMILTLFGFKFEFLIGSVLGCIGVIDVLYHKMSFLWFEGKLQQVAAARTRMENKINTLQKFFQEYDPRTMIRAINLPDTEQDHKSFGDELKMLSYSRLEMLEQNMEVIKNDKSVPILQNTGEISVLSKSYLAANLILMIIMFYDMVQTPNVSLVSRTIVMCLQFFVLPALGTRFFARRCSSVIKS